MSDAPDIGELEDRIGYRFADRDLLGRALTHVSGATRQGRDRAASYQRLEFLGDRVLGLAVAEMLTHEFPHAAEGELSQRLAAMVRKETCADVALSWDVGRFLKLGPGEAKAGGRKRATILGDVCEAIVGAIFLDEGGGYHAAKKVIATGFGPHVHEPKRALRDAKTALQEWAQARGLAAPTYRLMERSGPDHAPHFRIAVDVAGSATGEGQGRSKREAEQAAATAFLTREGIAHDA